jgi:hypothetical protein
MNNPTSRQSAAPTKRPDKTLPVRRPVFAPAPRPVVYRYTRQFQQQTQGGPIPATWGPRLVARLLELLVIGVPFNLLYDFFFLNFVPEDWQAIGLPEIGRDVIFWLVFAFVTTLTGGRSGSSFGKKLLNLKVAGMFNRRLPPGLFFLREALVIYSLTCSYQTINLLILSGPLRFLGLELLYLPGFGLGLGCLPLFLNPPRLALLDRLFKTQVVIADNQKLLGQAS